MKSFILKFKNLVCNLGIHFHTKVYDKENEVVIHTCQHCKTREYEDVSNWSGIGG